MSWWWWWWRRWWIHLNNKYWIMALPLTRIGVLWCFVSAANALLSCCSLYSPYWIRGEIFNRTEVYLGLIRRCNYPVVLENQRLEVMIDCGRYANFWAVPSPWWRLAVSFGGMSCTLALLVFFIIVLCCAVENSVSRISARLVGILQVFGGVVQLTAVTCFAMGLDNLEAREACGESSGAFRTGPKCDLFWAFYVASLSGLLALSGLAMAWRACDIEYSYLYRISTKKEHLLRSSPSDRMSLRAWAAESL